MELVQLSRAGVVLLELSDELLLVLEERYGILGTIREKRVKFVAAPFYAMLNLVGEVSQGAHWNGFLRRILGVAVALSLVRNDHLRVSFGAEGTGLEEWLFVPHTSLIDVETSLDVVDGVHNKVKSFPEIVVEGSFSVWSHKCLV